MSFRSSRVNTATTPGTCSARRASIARIRACGCGDRRTFPWSIPGSTMSPVYLARPVTFSTASTRGTEVPTTRKPVRLATFLPIELVDEPALIQLPEEARIDVRLEGHLRELRELRAEGLDEGSGGLDRRIRLLDDVERGGQSVRELEVLRPIQLELPGQNRQHGLLVRGVQDEGVGLQQSFEERLHHLGVAFGKLPREKDDIVIPRDLELPEVAQHGHPEAFGESSLQRVQRRRVDPPRRQRLHALRLGARHDEAAAVPV